MTESFEHTPAVGDIIELSPHDLTVDGGAVARHGGLVFFLDQGLPGERLRARVTDLKARSARAQRVETLEPSPHAMPPHCPHLGDCGGCAWSLEYSAELRWKEERVRESLRRIGNIALAPADSAMPAGFASAPGELPPLHPIIGSPRSEGYRNKLEFAFAPGTDGPMLGLHRRASHSIVEVGDCPLARSSVASLLTRTRAWAKEQGLDAWDGRSGWLRFLVVRQPEYAPEGRVQGMVELICASRPSAPQLACAKAFGEGLLRELPGITSFVLSERRNRAAIAYAEKIRITLGPDYIEEQAGHLVLQAPPQAFMQANSGAATLLYNAVRDALLAVFPDKNARIWELYSGVGSIGLFLARDAAQVHGIESAEQAVVYAERNAKANGLDHCAFGIGDAAILPVPPSGKAPDCVITDPPRGGMDPALIATLLSMAPKAIISVSCDPATQARDLARLSQDYVVRGVQTVDLFPHTPHVETVVLLERKNA